MKKLLFILCLALLSQISNAQFDLNKVSAGFTVGYAKPLGDFSEYAKGGFAYQLIGSYDLTKELALGLEYSAALTAALDSDLTGIFGLNIYGLQTLQLKSWYVFSEKRVSPYAGLGLGLARFTEPDVTINETTVEGSRRSGLGASGEVGLRIGGFQMSYAYVMNGKTSKEPVFNPNIVDLPIHYHRIALGYIYQF